MEVAAALFLFAFAAVGAEPPYLQDVASSGNCSELNFNAAVWMDLLPQPLELNVHRELTPEAEEVPAYSEPAHVEDPDYNLFDSESTDDDDAEHLGEVERRRRDVSASVANETAVLEESYINETQIGELNTSNAVEEVPLAMLRLKKCHRNNRLVLPNQPNKLMLKNFQKSKMSFFLSIEPQDAEACGLGSVNPDYYFQKLQGCWLEHKHKAHEICRKHGKAHHGHGHHHHGRRRGPDVVDDVDSEESKVDTHEDENSSELTPDVEDDQDLDDSSTSDERENEIITEREHEYHGRRGRRGRRHSHKHDHHGEQDHDDDDDDHDHHHGRRGHHHKHEHNDEHDHHHGRRSHHRRHDHDDDDDHHDGEVDQSDVHDHSDDHDHPHGHHHHGRGRGGRGHHHRGHHHHHHHDDHIPSDDVNGTLPHSKHSHHFVPAEGEVVVCNNTLEGWMEPESKLVVQYVSPACGCFEINVYVSFPTDNDSTLVLTPEANEEYLHIYECVDSHSSDEETGGDFSDVNLDGIDPRNIIDDDEENDKNDDNNRDDNDANDNDRDSDGDNNRDEDDRSNDIDSEEDHNAGNKYGLMRRKLKLRNRTINIRNNDDDDDDDDGDDDNDDDNDDDDDDDEDDDDGARRRPRSGRGRRAPEEEVDQQSSDSREERRRHRQENRRRKAERRRARGRAGAEGDEASDLPANTVDTDETGISRQERRRLKQQRRQQRRQQQGGGGGGRRLRGRGNRRRGNTEDGGDDFDGEPLTQAVHGSSNAIMTRPAGRPSRRVRRIRNLARRENRILMNSHESFGPKFCCKQGAQHKRASFFPDGNGTRVKLACEDVPEEVPMWGSHKFDVQADECVRLYTYCCLNFNLDQWNGWFISPVPEDEDGDVASTTPDDFDVLVSKSPPADAIEILAPQEPAL